MTLQTEKSNDYYQKKKKNGNGNGMVTRYFPTLKSEGKKNNSCLFPDKYLINI